MVWECGREWRGVEDLHEDAGRLFNCVWKCRHFSARRSAGKLRYVIWYLLKFRRNLLLPCSGKLKIEV